MLRFGEMDQDITRTHTEVAGILRTNADIVAGRVDDAHAPDWSNARGWSDFLLGLSDDDLARCETDGLAYVASALSDLPESLKALATRVRESSLIPQISTTARAESASARNEDYRGVSRRKQAQLSSLFDALTQLAEPAQRIVDVGAGSGHFARLAATRFDRDAVGLERDPARVEKARARAEAIAARAEFIELDAVRSPLQLRAGDLAVGLHACGELGDALVESVASSGVDLVLVSCCLQKVKALVRQPLSRDGVALERSTLGLSNLSSRPLGVEAELGLMLAARASRLALRRLLEARGTRLAPGEEMRGINRRRAHGGLALLAEAALTLRGLEQASQSELDAHERAGALEYACIRRLSLPRNMLARVVELSVNCDRALRLQESGHAVLLATLLDQSVTPRNLALFASRERARLPACC